MTEADIFIEMTKELLFQKRIYSKTVEFDINLRRNLIIDDQLSRIFDDVFSDRTAFFGGKELAWKDWLMNSNIPIDIYKQNDRDLYKFMDDKRIHQILGKNTQRSYLSMLCRELTYGNHLKYLLDRWSVGNNKSYPFYYFDTESIEWIWEELRKNQKQIKTIRASYSNLITSIAPEYTFEASGSSLHFPVEI